MFRISKEELKQKLNDSGYNRDIEINEEMWRGAKDDLEASQSILGLPSILKINQTIFRDKKRTKSIELKDYRNRKDYENEFVAELEHFNPERHPFLHSIIDVPLWALKNRVLNNGPKKVE